MTIANSNPLTGIRYGIISADALDPEVIDEIQQYGEDIHYEEWKSEIRASVHDDESIPDDEKDDVIEQRIEDGKDRFYDDEPVHEFTLAGVSGRTTWLGGAMLVWVFLSPHITRARLCSPCVPNCGDLNNVDPDGEECYDVPTDWRMKHE